MERNGPDINRTRLNPERVHNRQPNNSRNTTSGFRQVDTNSSRVRVRQIGNGSFVTASPAIKKATPNESFTASFGQRSLDYRRTYYNRGVINQVIRKANGDTLPQNSRSSYINLHSRHLGPRLAVQREPDANSSINIGNRRLSYDQARFQLANRYRGTGGKQYRLLQLTGHLIVDPEEEELKNTDMIKGAREHATESVLVAAKLARSHNKAVVKKTVREFQNRDLSHMDEYFRQYRIIGPGERTVIRNQQDLELYVKRLDLLARKTGIQNPEKFTYLNRRQLFRDRNASAVQVSVVHEMHQTRNFRNASKGIKAEGKKGNFQLYKAISKRMSDDVFAGFDTIKRSVTTTWDTLKASYFLLSYTGRLAGRATRMVGRGAMRVGGFAGGIALKTNTGRAVFDKVTSSSAYNKLSELHGVHQRKREIKTFKREVRKENRLRRRIDRRERILNRRRARIDRFNQTRLGRVLARGSGVARGVGNVVSFIGAPLRGIGWITSIINKIKTKLILAAGLLFLFCAAGILITSGLLTITTSILNVPTFIMNIISPKENEASESTMETAIARIIDKDADLIAEIEKKANKMKPRSIKPEGIFNKRNEEITEFSIPPSITLKSSDGMIGGAADNKKAILSMASVYAFGRVNEKEMIKYVEKLYDASHSVTYDMTSIAYDVDGEECTEIAYFCGDPDIDPEHYHEKCKYYKTKTVFEDVWDGTYNNCKGHTYYCTNSNIPSSWKYNQKCKHKIVNKINDLKYSNCTGNHRYSCADTRIPKDLQNQNSCMVRIQGKQYNLCMGNHTYSCNQKQVNDYMKKDECISYMDEISYEYKCKGHIYKCNDTSTPMALRHSDCKRYKTNITTVYTGEYNYSLCNGHGIEYGNNEGLPYCPGHVGLIATIHTETFDSHNSLFDLDDTPTDDEWGGWDETTMQLARYYADQDWYSLYGVSFAGSSSLPNVGATFTPVEVNQKMDELVAYELITRGKKLNEAQINMARFAYETAGRIPYYWGGRTSIRNFTMNEFGKPTKPDTSKHHRALHGLDCSGYVAYVYDVIDHNNLGHRGTATFKSLGTYYTWSHKDKIEVGDVVWIGRETENGYSGHVGIYVGNNKVIEEVGNPTNNVIESELDTSKWYGFIKINIKNKGQTITKEDYLNGYRPPTQSLIDTLYAD